MNKNKVGLYSIIALLAWMVTSPAYALTFAIQPGSDIVGTVQTATILRGESLEDIGQRFDVGIYELIESNPGIDPEDPQPGKAIIIPTQYILPSGPRQGIVINLAEMRIYYYHKDQQFVTTHPIGIGKKDWQTPIGQGKITEKTKDPYWRPPDSIRAWYDEHKMYLPEVVPPGPLNPLGKYAMRLSIPGYLIHGTNTTGGIGVRSSSGCIRMHPEDIESLFYKVSVGETVRIVHKPYKIGRYNNKIYIEKHEPLSDEYYHAQSDEEVLEEAIEEANLRGAYFNKEKAKKSSERSLGYPTLIE